MTPTEAGIVTTLIVQAAYAFRWLVGLEGRIGSHEKECGERMRRYDERHETILAHILDIKQSIAESRRHPR